MIKQFVCLLLTISLASANIQTFQDCGSTAIVHSLRLGSCWTRLCWLQRGTTMTIEMHITKTSHGGFSLPFEVYAIPEHPQLNPIRLMSGELCNAIFVGANCPVSSGQFFAAAFPLTISPSFPSSVRALRFVVDYIVCVEVPVVVG